MEPSGNFIGGVGCDVPMEPPPLPLPLAGGADLFGGAAHRELQGGGDGDLLHLAVAPAEGCRSVGPVQGPHGHGQELT